MEVAKLYVQEKIQLHELLNNLQKLGKSESEQKQAYEQFLVERNQ